MSETRPSHIGQFLLGEKKYFISCCAHLWLLVHWLCRHVKKALSPFQHSPRQRHPDQHKTEEKRQANCTFPLWVKIVLKQINQQHKKNSSKSLVSYLLGKEETQVITSTMSKGLSNRTGPRWVQLPWCEEQPPDFRAQRCWGSEVPADTCIVRLIWGYRQGVHAAEGSYQLFVGFFLFYIFFNIKKFFLITYKLPKSKYQFFELL